MNDSVKKRLSSPIAETLESESTFLDLGTISSIDLDTSDNPAKYDQSLLEQSASMKVYYIRSFKKFVLIASLISILCLFNWNNILQRRSVVYKKLYLKDIKDESANPNLKFNEMYDEFYRIKRAVKEVFVSAREPLDFCTHSSVNNLTGPIDVEETLSELNVSDLVEFYKPKNASYNSTYEETELWNSTDINLLNTSIPVNSTNLVDYAHIELGGHWKPRECKSRFKIAIIIPFRDRLPHLKVITNYLHMFLQHQLLDYRIFVVEPTIPLNVSFNKGRVMNSAYLEALKVDKYDCIIFHDVDLVPEDIRNVYTCTSRPRHLSVAIDKFDYVLPYSYLVGGVLSIRSDQYQFSNGYSNSYWGWGGEDDDFANRLTRMKLLLERPPKQIARYKMMRHKPQKMNKDRFKLLRRTSRMQKNDGLNNVQYKIVENKNFNLFTYILIDVGMPK